MKRGVFYSLTALLLVLGLILPMAVPVMASEVTATKNVDPDEAPYWDGETITYVMTVSNPITNLETNTIYDIWDTLPDGSIYYFVEAGVDPPLVQLPGDSAAYNITYVVDCNDIEYDTRLGYWIVQNTFEVSGTDTAFDEVYAFVQTSTEVIPCEPVGGEAFPIGKLPILAPWIVLGAAIVAGAAIFVRRRHARS